ncbi:glycoside hydrolase family 15 protein [Streptomyces sp. NPDC004044]
MWCESCGGPSVSRSGAGRVSTTAGPRTSSTSVRTALSSGPLASAPTCRYDPAASPDGLRGSEGTFSLCTFLYVDATARAGRLPPARYAFEKMQTYANHVGLFAEEIGPSGEQLGNFPQAFTHLSLIMAATTLDAALDLEEGR